MNNSNLQSFAPRDLLQLCCFTDSRLLVFLCACVLRGRGTTSTWRQQADASAASGETLKLFMWTRPCDAQKPWRIFLFLFSLFSTGVPFFLLPANRTEMMKRWNLKIIGLKWVRSTPPDSVEAHRVFVIFVHQHMEKNSRGLSGACIVAGNCSDYINMDTTNCCLLLLMQLLSLLVIPAGTQYKTPAFTCDLVCVLSQAELRKLAFIVAVALNRFVFQSWQGNSQQGSAARDTESQKIRLMSATDACYTTACSTLPLPDAETWQFYKNLFLPNVIYIYRGKDTAALFMSLLRFVPFYLATRSRILCGNLILIAAAPSTISCTFWS